MKKSIHHEYVNDLEGGKIVRRPREKFVAIDATDRQNVRYLGSGKAAVCLKQVHNIRISSEALRGLGENSPPWIPWNDGERRYLRRTLDAWAKGYLHCAQQSDQKI